MAKTRKASMARTENTGAAAGRRPGKGGRKSATPRQTREQVAAATKPATAESSPPGTAARRSKRSTILALLQRPKGAAISELTAATGWQAHSVRAVLTGFRKEGKDLVRAKDEVGVTHYRLTGEA